MSFTSKAVVLLSGGLDSTTTLAIAKSEPYYLINKKGPVTALFFCSKQTLFKSLGHPSSITLVANLQLCLVLHAVFLRRIRR